MVISWLKGQDVPFGDTPYGSIAAIAPVLVYELDVPPFAELPPISVNK